MAAQDLTVILDQLPDLALGIGYNPKVRETVVAVCRRDICSKQTVVGPKIKMVLIPYCSVYGSEGTAGICIVSHVRRGPDIICPVIKTCPDTVRIIEVK